MFRIKLLAAILLLPFLLIAQSSIRDSSISMVMVSPGFGYQFPGGDLAKRFGSNYVVSMDVTYKHRKKWMLGVEGGYFFSDKVKEPTLFSHLINDQGQIVGDDGHYADIRINERGYYLTLSLGRFFNFKKPNPNCGFFVNAGGGFMEHKIRIEDHNKTVPGLEGDYKKGYDRLTNGFCLRESVGYLYISNHRLVNFHLSLDAIQGFTKSRRDFNFDDMNTETKQRLDLLYGARIGWV